ncbi:hypothetical protein V3W47_17405 [Deinococcus sp. YIM 134068]|uniref:hypothetical protein n=1 Tax=Deinococcus lichenicola TaxID=3118910 RepID=UPI002F95057C
MPHDHAPLAAPPQPVPTRRPSRYWTGFVLSLLFPGSGLAFIHRPGLAVAFILITTALTSGPVARLVTGSFADTWGVFLGLAAIPVGLILYRQVYVAQDRQDAPAPRKVPMFWRLLGVWLPLLLLGVYELGYAQGWLPRAPGSQSLGR